MRRREFLKPISKIPMSGNGSDFAFYRGALTLASPCAFRLVIAPFVGHSRLWGFLRWALKIANFFGTLWTGAIFLTPKLRLLSQVSLRLRRIAEVLQGLAPCFVDTRLRLKVSDEAVGAVFDFEYEALLTQSLVLTPRFEADAYSDDVPKLGIGSGLSSVTPGLRLCYEFIREFTPYIGVEHANTFGRTKNLYDGGEDTRFVAGVHFWF